MPFPQCTPGLTLRKSKAHGSLERFFEINNWIGQRWEASLSSSSQHATGGRRREPPARSRPQTRTSWSYWVAGILTPQTAEIEHRTNNRYVQLVVTPNLFASIGEIFRKSSNFIQQRRFSIPSFRNKPQRRLLVARLLVASLARTEAMPNWPSTPRNGDTAER